MRVTEASTDDDGMPALPRTRSRYDGPRRQNIDPLSVEAISYYHETGPVGELFNTCRSSAKPEMAVIGLGTGTLASYCQKGQHITFSRSTRWWRIAETPTCFPRKAARIAAGSTT